MRLQYLRLPRLNSTSVLHCKQYPPSPLQTRPFISYLAPPSTPERLTATRTLPYPARPLFQIIADVSSYKEFLPFLISSDVHTYSSPDPLTNTRWPHLTTLTVGYGTFKDRYASRVYCLPDKIVEAVGGRTSRSEDLEECSGWYPPDHPNARPPLPGGRGKGDLGLSKDVFRHLLTRWVLRPLPYKPGPSESSASSPQGPTVTPAMEWTQVSLTIEYTFANPIYAALAKAAAPKVAGTMMEAFERRVRDIEGRKKDGRLGKEMFSGSGK
ncbi:MAG: hypothetical protein M1834_003675 [Cirrosporium novae-zelandiae]|nr:MAG: hypothetical protein M1834_003675 [Cirrosporium novae-zelandiae]